MSGFKEVMKNGWHPEKSGGSIRGSVSSLMGRNKDSASDSSNHVARPLSDLKDPASFAPPPRRTGSALAPGPPPVSTKRKVVTSPSKYRDPRDESNEPPETRYGAGARDPPPYGEATRTASAAPKAVPPSLPPRLPPRPAASSPAGDETAHGMLNGHSVSRLGAAGVSVPALGIGRGGAAAASPGPSPSSPPPASQPSAGSAAGKWGSQVNELQGRFSKMKTSSPSPSAQEPPAHAEGTTWAQKQAALKTASNFHKDPSSVSFADAKAAASTANNFRQRHGEQVASGVKTANNLNQKYGLMDKVGAYTGSQATHATTQPPPPPSSSSSLSSPPPLPGPSQPSTGSSFDKISAALSGAAGKKKPPPPPPPSKKKPALAANPAPAAQEDGPPPPIPMSTRPAF